MLLNTNKRYDVDFEVNGKCYHTSQMSSYPSDEDYDKQDYDGLIAMECAMGIAADFLKQTGEPGVIQKNKVSYTISKID